MSLVLWLPRTGSTRRGFRGGIGGKLSCEDMDVRPGSDSCAAEDSEFMDSIELVDAASIGSPK